MAPHGPHFSPKTLSFLRSLARHNDREWFRDRKGTYEAEVKAPMLEVIGALDRDFRRFAPELVASPRTSLFRIYRDTRFSEDKSPFKTHVAAVFPVRGRGKNEGPGLYLEVNGRHVLLAGGLYAPAPPDLLAVRRHVSQNHFRLRSIVDAPAFRRVAGRLQGDELLRMPKGFAADHPAAPLLRKKQFLVWRELPAEVAIAPRFYATVLRFFEVAAPLVRFLSEPIRDRAGRTPVP